jgi:integrase
MLDTAKCDPDKSASFLWDSEAPGLGLRISHGGAKRYVFQAKMKQSREVVRVKIGDIGTYTIDAARVKARALKSLMDAGHDPRKLEQDARDAEQDARDARKAATEAEANRAKREAVTLGDVWPEYSAARKPFWSEVHCRDHQRIMQAGGVQRLRGQGFTKPGPLASLASVRLVDLTARKVEAWAKIEGKARPTSARLALRLLKACLTWCASSDDYAGFSDVNAAKSKSARESLGKVRKKSDVLQREQLVAWFAAVRQIDNPVISTYLQCLLLTGARREELAKLRWGDVDFKWNSLKLNDKVEEFRMVPLTPYVSQLLTELRRQNETPPTVRRIRTLAARGEEWKPSPWVFLSDTSESGRITDPSNAHRTVCAIAGLSLTLHGLRRSFATLSEWTETPAGIAAQIQGHAPQGVREQNYIRRPLDLLRMWHVKIEQWMLQQGRVEYPEKAHSLEIVRTENSLRDERK